MSKIILDADSKDYKGGTKETVNLEKSKDQNNHIMRQRKIAEITLSDIEVQELTKKYSRSVVQDFDDEFHMTKEQQNKLRKEHEKLFKLRNMRKTCSRLSEFVINWRLCLDALEEVAASNKIMSPDDFTEAVLKGDYVVNGLKFPRYNKKRKKSINWEYIMNEYILNRDRDPYELDNAVSEIIADIDPDEIANEILDENVETAINIKDDEMEKIYDLYSIANPEKSNGKVVTQSDKKYYKDIKKHFPEISRTVKKRSKIDKKVSSVSCGYGHINNIEDKDFKFFEKYNRHMQTKFKKPEFKGDISNKDDVDEYLFACEEYESETNLIEYNGRYYTQDELNEMELKSMLEYNGWNLKNCFRDKKQEKEDKKRAKKENKKKKYYEKLIQKMNDRQDKREKHLNGIPEGINIEEEVKKQRKKKKGKKSHKKNKKEFDSMIMNASGKSKKYDSMSSYEKDMEDFRWQK